MVLSGILLNFPLLSAKVATGIKNHHAVQFYLFIDENQGGLAGGPNSGPQHHTLWILEVLDDSSRAGSLGAPAPVALMMVGLFDGE